MKKRIFSALICAVIAALSILTAFSGCTGTSYPKVVADRDEFFSKISGRYGNSKFNIYVSNDGSFQLNIPDYRVRTCNFKGSFNKVYQDSEYIYHAEMSKLNKSINISIPENNKPIIEDNIFDETIAFHLSSLRFLSNDIIYIYAPGMPVSEIPRATIYGLEEEFDVDKNSDGNLDDYILINYRRSGMVISYEAGDYITYGLWIDFNSSNSTLDVYNFEDFDDINVTTYDLFDNKLTQIEYSYNKPKPLYYVTSGSNVIVFYDNGKANIICPNGESDNYDINKKKYYTEATDSTSKSPHKLIHYDKLPDYNTIIKEKNGNQ